MKQLLFTTAAIAFAAPALAGSLDAPAPEPAPTVPVQPVATTYDWSGFYAGVYGGMGFGSVEEVPGGTDDLTSDFAYGGFAGYNMQNGPYVYGAEIAGGMYNGTPSTAPGEGYDFLLDGKLRAGYAFDNVLVYGFGGGTWGNYTEGPASDWSVYGPNFGAGAEVALTDNVSVGAEYIGRYLMGTTTGGADQNAWLHGVNARVALRF